MKKGKLLLMVCLFMLIAVSSSFASRIGIEIGNPAAVIILRLQPFDFKLGYNFEGLGSNNGAAFVHVSADYRIIETRLIDFLNFYVGAGLYAQVQTAGDANFVFGGRLPVVGINAYLAKGTIEIFLEIVPALTFLPGISYAQSFQGWLGFTVAIPKF